jgi:dipeptidyl aminopeptidase/acylaminoacyl peptidase
MRCVFVAMAVFCAGLGACCPMESRFVTPRERLTWQTPARAADVWLDGADGGQIHGWLFRPQGAAQHASERRPAILYLHGRADSIAVYADAAPDFADAAGATLLMIDYRGWGRSSDPSCVSRRTMLDDARNALDFLRQQPEVDLQRIAVWGVSLGGFPSTALFAEEPDLAALVLWASPADSKWLLADHRKRIGFLPSLIGSVGIRRWREPQREIARTAGRPVLIVHGLLDGVVPVRHGVRLHNAALAAGTAVEWHSDLSGHEGISQAGRDRIASFLREQLHSGPTPTP